MYGYSSGKTPLEDKALPLRRYSCGPVRSVTNMLFISNACLMCDLIYT